MSVGFSIANRSRAERRHVCLDGINYHYHAVGVGTPVVIVHRGAIDYWEMANRLGPGFRLIFLDFSPDKAPPEDGALLDRIVDLIERRDQEPSDAR